MNSFLKWLPLVTLLIGGFGAVYNQGVRIEHRLTVVETKIDLHLLQTGSRVIKPSTRNKINVALCHYEAFK